MNIFRKKVTNYSTSLGGQSYKELEELREENKNKSITTNTFRTREEYNKARLTKELEELEQELRTKKGEEFYKERVKQLEREIRTKQRELRELGKSKSKQESKLSLLKKLFSFK